MAMPCRSRGSVADFESKLSCCAASPTPRASGALSRMGALISGRLRGVGGDDDGELAVADQFLNEFADADFADARYARREDRVNLVRDPRNSARSDLDRRRKRAGLDLVVQRRAPQAAAQLYLRAALKPNFWGHVVCVGWLRDIPDNTDHLTATKHSR